MQIITDEFQKELKKHGNYDFPFLLSYEKLSRYETGSFLWHWHPAIELTYITDGEMIYKVNNNSYHLKQGEGLFSNASALHAGFMYENQDCAYISITFDPKLIYGYENSIIDSKYVKPLTQNFSLSSIHFDLSELWHKNILDIIQDIIQMESEKNSCYELYILMKLNQFWQQLFLQSEGCLTKPSFDKKNYDRIRSILSFIEENYAEKITLDQISNQIHLCKGECSRIFKKYMNISLFEFLLQYRIEKSVDYILHTNYSITDIAQAVGFYDSNYFTKIFRRQKGCSPTKYRQTMKTDR